jgi:glucose-6-phosphate 1-dehydrogenase
MSDMNTISEPMKEGIVLNTTSSDALVFFGATGDLAHKKIFPAADRNKNKNTGPKQAGCGFGF